MKRKPRIVKRLSENQIMRKIYKYERIPEDKQRRKELTYEDKGEWGQFLAPDPNPRYINSFLDMAFRQGNKFYKLVLRKVRKDGRN